MFELFKRLGNAEREIEELKKDVRRLERHVEINSEYTGAVIVDDRRLIYNYLGVEYVPEKRVYDRVSGKLVKKDDGVNGE